ncbi:NHLP family bacteriocin export ABC transporter peptidase/permease/ATPase subunit [Denitratisoma sp. agr-D3]
MIERLRGAANAIVAFLGGQRARLNLGAKGEGGTRVRTPTVLQMEAAECGAASLAMILGYHGRWVSLEQLRLECGVSRDGSKASNVLKAARVNGLNAKGFKKEPEQLASLPLPSIIHWNFNHYLVFEGIVGGKAYLNDPSLGPRQVDLAELNESFTGVVLAFTPGPEFQPGGQPPRGWRQLFDHLGEARRTLGYVAALSIMLAVPGIVIPALSKQFVDQVLVQQMKTWVVPLCLGLLAAGLFQTALTWFQRHALVRLQAGLSTVMATRYLSRLLRLPQEFFTPRQSGDLANRFAATERVAQLLSGELSTNLFNLSAALLYVIAMAGYDLTLACLGVAATLANIALLRLASRRRTDLNRKLANDQGKLLGATASTIVTIETLKVGGGENAAFAAWSGYQAQALSTQQELGFQDGMLNASPALLSSLTTAAILGLGGLRVIGGELSIGSLVAIQTLMGSLTGPMTSLVGLGSRLQAVTSDLERLGDVLGQPEPKPPVAQAGVARLEGRVEMRDIVFGYNPCEDALVSDFAMRLAPGMRVALVGASGSGKSTLGRLLCGLYRPWQGEVLIDGRPVAEIDPDLMANSVAYVDQDIFLFEGTVRDNLTLWDDSVPEAALVQALKDAEIHAEIMARPGHLGAAVAEGGMNFSGGQRQRLELARALVGDPSILVLDEATAALDPVVEKQIDDNLRRRGCTCVIIAHRLSTIRDCDEIIVLRHGRVVERGNHDSLVARDGAYADLIRAGR